MNTMISVSYQTDRNSKALSSYRLSLSETDEQPTERLTQIGEVFNGIVTYRGVFRRHADGLQALMDFIAAPCKLVEFNAGGEVSYALQTQGQKTRLEGFTTSRVLAARSPSGTFVAF